MADPAPAVDAISTAAQSTPASAGPDPEIAAIGKVNDALAQLDPAVRQRVLRWAADKFGVSLPKNGRAAAADDIDDEEEQADESESEAPGTFADFASLYDAANPTTEADKALVAGYWIQVVQGNAEWGSYAPNKELRNLGHGVDNITVALGALIDSTPRLAMQTHKSGKARQGRKKYKLTTEGIRRVKQMLAGNGGQD